jgi:isopenicillin-N epimerase
MATSSDLRDLYLLDPETAYLNHGGFGAVPIPVFEERQRILREVEANPTAHFMRQLKDRLAEAIVPVAGALGVEAHELAFTTNATAGLNLIARSVMPTLRAGDEILLTDVEYGSQKILWEWVCQQRGAVCRTVPVCGLSQAETVEALEGAVTDATRLLLMSHISSATALRLPVAATSRRLRALGVTVVVDGAHAPGHISLDLGNLGCDYFVGNLHKWFAAARGTAVIYARAARQAELDPLIVSWGGTDRSSPLAARVHTPGTADASAWLAAPTALTFHAEYLAPARASARQLLEKAAAELAELGYERTGHADDDIQMAAFWTPTGVDSEQLDRRLKDAKIEAVVMHQDDRSALRISVAWYTVESEIARLLDVLRSK